MFVVPSEFIDEYGHVNYKRYLAILEIGQDALMTGLEIPFTEIERKFGLRSVVRGFQSDFPQSVLEGDKIDILTQVDNVGKSSILFAQEIERAGELIHQFRMVVVLMNKQGSASVPDEIREKLLG